MMTKTMLLFVLVATFLASVLGQEKSGSQYKKIVTYLGTDFILHSGCPQFECSGAKCQQLQQDYKTCLR